MLLALRHALKQSCHRSVAWSIKLCWLLTTFQSDSASAHRRPSLVSLCIGFSRVSRLWCTGVVFMQPWIKVSAWCIILWYLATQTVLLSDICQAAGDFCFPAHHARVRKRTELLRHKTPLTPDMASQQTRPQFCRLQITDSHSGMRLSETARDVKHRWWAVVINRMTFFYQLNDVLYFTRHGRK